MIYKTDRDALEAIRDMILFTEDDPEELPMRIVEIIEEHLSEEE